MPAGGVSPTGNPRHETGFEPPARQRKPKLLNGLREALRSRHPALRDRRTEQSSCYRHVLDRRIGDLGPIVRARRPTRLPVVLTRQEVKAILNANFSVLPQSPRRTQRATKPFLGIQAQQVLGLGTVLSRPAGEKSLAGITLRSLRSRR